MNPLINKETVMSQHISLASQPIADRPGEHNHISLDDLKKIRGGVGEPMMPASMSAVEKSDEDFPAPAMI